MINSSLLITFRFDDIRKDTIEICLCEHKCAIRRMYNERIVIFQRLNQIGFET